MEMVINETDTVHPNILSLANMNDLPSKKSVLILYHFFINLDRPSYRFSIGDVMLCSGPACAVVSLVCCAIPNLNEVSCPA